MHTHQKFDGLGQFFLQAVEKARMHLPSKSPRPKTVYVPPKTAPPFERFAQRLNIDPPNGTNGCHKVWELRLTEYREAVFTGGNAAARSGHSMVDVNTKHSPPFTIASSLPPSFRPRPSFFRNGPSSRPRQRQLCPCPPKSPMYHPWRALASPARPLASPAAVSEPPEKADNARTPELTWRAHGICAASIVTPPVLANWHNMSSELLSAKQHRCPSPAAPSSTARRPLAPLVRQHPCRHHTSAATL
ncbi:hypothetical protein C8J57DRAFT_1476093 [Mycena rebaudengoi]|nr:hypothetical protein C8J57DRAFT_1476093 [Mycena rebaudengoi]